MGPWSKCLKGAFLLRCRSGQRFLQETFSISLFLGQRRVLQPDGSILWSKYIIINTKP